MYLTGLTSPGVILGLVSAALFGASTPLAKLLLGQVDPWLLAGMLYLGSGFGLAAVHFTRRASASSRRKRRSGGQTCRGWRRWSWSAVCWRRCC